MLNKSDFIDACATACDSGTFVTAKHDATNLTTLYSQPRSINCMGNTEMAAYLRKGDFKVHCYSDSDPKHTPELYIITPNDSSIVPGSGVGAMSSTPSTQCDVFSVPSGVVQGWHGYAYDSTKVTNRAANGQLTLLGEIT